MEYRCTEKFESNLSTTIAKTNFKVLRCFVSVDVGADSFRIQSNGIPDHNACTAPPRSTVDSMSYDYQIPLKPQKLPAMPTESTNMGVVGFAKNGVPIFNPYDSSCCDAGIYELEDLDLCYAHPNGPGGAYHYHTWSECLRNLS